MQFTENEIPFQTLDRLGLTREMIEDLPVRITNDILEGRRSPVLPIMVVDSDGNEVKSRSRFKLIRKEDGDVDALYQRFIDAGILGGVKFDGGLLFAVTEKRTKEEIDNLVKIAAL